MKDGTVDGKRLISAGGPLAFTAVDRGDVVNGVPSVAVVVGREKRPNGEVLLVPKEHAMEIGQALMRYAMQKR